MSDSGRDRKLFNAYTTEDLKRFEVELAERLRERGEVPACDGARQGGMSEQRIAEIREREAKATKGPWFAEEEFSPQPYYTPSWSIVNAPHHPSVQLSRYVASAEHCMDDAEFIAHARADIPFLLSVIDALSASPAEACREEVWWIALNGQNQIVGAYRTREQAHANTSYVVGIKPEPAETGSASETSGDTCKTCGGSFLLRDIARCTCPPPSASSATTEQT